MQKVIIVFLLLIGSSRNLLSQTIITTVGKVIFFDNKDSLKSKQLHEIAKLCDCYIQKFYSGVKLPNILLDVEQSKDTAYYQLGYDNIYGNSIDNDVYERKTNDYTNLGIRIKSCSADINEESILKLLDYGINHEQELKTIRLKEIKLDYYDRSKNITLKEKTISQILKCKSLDKIKLALRNCM